MAVMEQVDRTNNLLKQLFKKNAEVIQAINNTSSEAILSEIKEIFEYSVWDKIPGNEIETAYYSGVDATNNPSGNKNVASRTFKRNGTTVLVQTFAWDAADDQVSVAST